MTDAQTPTPGDTARPPSSARRFERHFLDDPTGDLGRLMALYVEAGGTEEDYNVLCDVNVGPEGFEVDLDWPDGSHAVYYQADRTVVVTKDLS